MALSKLSKMLVAAVISIVHARCQSTTAGTTATPSEGSPDASLPENPNRNDVTVDRPELEEDTAGSSRADTTIAADTGDSPEVLALDIGTTVRQEIYLDDADSLMIYQTGLEGIAGTAATRILTGTIEEHYPIETLSTGKGYAISEQCPNSNWGSAFEPVMIAPDGELDESYLSPDEFACGYVPDSVDGSIWGYRDAGIADLLSDDGSPHPTCTMKVDFPKFPEWAGFEAGGRHLIVIRSQRVYDTASISEGGTFVNVVTWVAPIDDTGMVVTPDGAWKPSEFVTVAEVSQWRNARAACDYYLAGSPNDKTWEDFLPK